MSLILDALKKSEAERQRHSGPTLLDVRIARPQQRYPIWAFIVGGLLLINIALLLVFVLRRSPGDAVIAGSGAGTAPAVTAVPTPAPAPPAAAVASAAPAAPVVAPVVAPAVASPQPSSPPPSSMNAPASAPPTLADEGADDASANPADEEPALPASAPRQTANGSVKYQRDDSGGYSSLPSYSELGGNVPPLRLDLHVYAERPRDRYAMINMQPVHEGDTLSEGMRVLAITRDGVALDFRGQQFMLRPLQ